MITGYVGLIGQGKTMLAVRDAVGLARRRGALLASNIEVVAPGVELVRLSVGDDGLEGVAELLERAHAEGRGVVLLVDEIGIILPSRFWQTAMSIDLMWACSQSRKLGADLIFTAQDVSQVDRFLRLLTQWVYRCRAFPSPSIERREKGKRPWFYVVSQFRPADAELGRAEKRLGRAMIRYRREWESTYNTDELVRPPRLLRGKRPSDARSVRSSSPEVKEESALGAPGVKGLPAYAGRRKAPLTPGDLGAPSPTSGEVERGSPPGAVGPVGTDHATGLATEEQETRRSRRPWQPFIRPTPG